MSGHRPWKEIRDELVESMDEPEIAEYHERLLEAQREYLRPEDYGHWEGTAFVFDNEITMIDESGARHPMRGIEFDGMELQDDITPWDVVHALLNPVTREEAEGFPGMDSSARIVDDEGTAQ